MPIKSPAYRGRRAFAESSRIVLRTRPGSGLDAFGELQGLFDVRAELADGAFDLCRREKDLNCTTLPVRVADHQGFVVSKGVRALILRLTVDADDSLANKAGTASSS